MTAHDDRSLFSRSSRSASRVRVYRRIRRPRVSGRLARVGVGFLHLRVRAHRAAAGGVRRSGYAGRRSDEDIEVLVQMRQQNGKLRRALAAHRSALVALTHPELEALGNNASGERFQSLFTRFEATLQEARDAREAIVGSFDVLIARGGHQTNQIMKVLTLASVILLPGALMAGVMGMNFKVGFFENAWLFWVVVAAIVLWRPSWLESRNYDAGSRASQRGSRGAAETFRSQLRWIRSSGAGTGSGSSARIACSPLIARSTPVRRRQRPRRRSRAPIGTPTAAKQQLPQVARRFGERRCEAEAERPAAGWWPRPTAAPL